MPDVGCAGILVEDTFCGPMAGLPGQGSLLALEAMPVKAGGCAANVAIDLAKQGISVDVLGCLGRDSAAEFLLQTYERYRVGHSNVVRVDDYGTSKCIILIVEGEDRRYLFLPGANQALSVEHIRRDWLGQLKVFYLGGLFVLPGIDPDALIGLLKFCREKGVTTIVDVVVPHGLQGMSHLQGLLPWIDIFVPTEDEGRAFTGLADPQDQLRAFERAGARTVIITCGSQGSVATSLGKRWRCGTYPVKVVDPSGSGDAFTSGVIRGHLLGWEFSKTLRYASAIGASVTRSPGTNDSIFSVAEAEAFMTEHVTTVAEEV
jgi:sugar/nucleoside kinase (ribokinase family)